MFMYGFLIWSKYVPLLNLNVEGKLWFGVAGSFLSGFLCPESWTETEYMINQSGWTRLTLQRRQHEWWLGRAATQKLYDKLFEVWWCDLPRHQRPNGNAFGSYTDDLPPGWSFVAMPRKSLMTLLWLGWTLEWGSIVKNCPMVWRYRKVSQCSYSPVGFCESRVP